MYSRTRDKTGRLQEVSLRARGWARGRLCIWGGVQLEEADRDGACYEQRAAVVQQGRSHHGRGGRGRGVRLDSRLCSVDEVPACVYKGDLVPEHCASVLSVGVGGRVEEAKAQQSEYSRWRIPVVWHGPESSRDGYPASTTHEWADARVGYLEKMWAGGGGRGRVGNGRKGANRAGE